MNTKKIQLFTLIISSLFLSRVKLSHAQDSFTIEKMGYFVVTDSLVRDYRFQEVKNLDFRQLGAFLEQAIEQEIIKANTSFNDDHITLSNLAMSIAYVSIELGLDPFILTALIYKESSFDTSAISPTGAKGLTQLLPIAVKEVYDQLGGRGAAHARPSNTLYYKNIIAQLDKNIHNLFAPTFMPSSAKQGDLRAFIELSQRFPFLNITYGALFLKILMAKKYHPNRGLQEQYRLALIDYNGEPGQRKVRYANDVMAKANALLTLFKSQYFKAKNVL